MIGIGVGHMKDRIETEGIVEALVTVESRSGSRSTTNRDRIRCFECREYDHFTRDCLTMQANREAKQIHRCSIWLRIKQ